MNNNIGYSLVVNNGGVSENYDSLKSRNFVKPKVDDKVSSYLRNILESGQINKNKNDTIKNLKEIKPEDLSALMLDLKLLEVNDPIQLARELASIVDFDKLQETVRAKYPNYKDAVTAAKGMLRQAQDYLEKNRAKTSPSVFFRMSTVINKLISLLENFISAFGIADMFKQSENEYQSESRSMKIFTLLSVYSALSAAMIPIIGPVGAVLLIGGGLLAFTALSLIYPRIRPMATSLPKAMNLTELYREGKLNVEGGRVETKKDISDTLKTVKGQGNKKHPMLIGKSGVGKTQTVFDFVAGIERGEYPEFKGKQVFYIKTADLITPTNKTEGGSNRVLNKISEIMGRHRDKYILVFDEVHLAFKSDMNSYIGEQLKLLVDSNSPENFPYVMGITTDEEYWRDIYVHNTAFARRFKCIAIDNTSDEDTLGILKNSFLKQAPNTIIENEKVLKSLVEKTKKAFPKGAQPATSLTILTQCVNRTGQSQKSEKEAKLEETATTVNNLYTQRAVCQGENILPYDSNENTKIQQLEESLSKLQKEISDHEKSISEVFNKKNKLSEIREKTFKAALEIAKIRNDKLSTKEKNQINEFLILSHFIAPALKRSVEEKADEFGLKIVIDEKLIDAVIQEEKDNEKKAQEFIERGKKQLLSRAEDSLPNRQPKGLSTNGNDE